MLRSVSILRKRWPLKAPFRISRGVKTTADTVIVELRRGGAVGRGESVPYARYGECVDGVMAQLETVGSGFEAGDPDAGLLAMLPAGAARNALDCALWDLRSRETGETVAQLTGLARPARLACAMTVGLDEPEAMAAAARSIAFAPLIKVKLDNTDVEARLLAIGQAAPNSRLIIDPNESWSFDTLKAVSPLLARLNIALIEQPLPAGDDHELEGFVAPAPICADESVHTADGLNDLKARYQAVNIKLDKTGGLTAAIHLLDEARRQRFTVMTGCMVGSSLAIAPALHIAGASDFADLDGPWWLAGDWPCGLKFAEGWLTSPATGFWGEPG
ncbi:MAG: L-Ala-D/L-Glu epimerase [Caulobacter sp.]|nr:L-Ala-D/L-Glu epimerase [Caulobacter sp.]